MSHCLLEINFSTFPGVFLFRDFFLLKVKSTCSGQMTITLVSQLVMINFQLNLRKSVDEDDSEGPISPCSVVSISSSKESVARSVFVIIIATFTRVTRFEMFTCVYSPVFIGSLGSINSPVSIVSSFVRAYSRP